MESYSNLYIISQQPIYFNLDSTHDQPNNLGKANLRVLSLSTSGHMPAKLGRLPVILPPVFVEHMERSWSELLRLVCSLHSSVNTLRPRQDGRHFADDILKCILFNENVWIPIKISLKSVPKGPINNIPAMVKIMAWRRPGDKPLSEPMVVSLPTHIRHSASMS